MEGVGVTPDCGTKGNWGQDTGGLYVSKMGCGAMKRSGKVWVDCIKVSDWG